MPALAMANTALAVDQAMIGISGNNIANLDNPDYARREASLSELPPAVFGTFTIGTGVQLDRVIGIRDNALNLRIAAEQSDVAGSHAFATAMQAVEAQFPADNSSGIGAALDKFWSAWQTLSSDPSGVPGKTQVLSAAQSLASAFHEVSAGLLSTNNSVSQSLAASVSQANALLSQIATLNQSAGSATPETLDAQDHALSRLSGFINISVVRAGNTLQISTPSGVPLVSGTKWFSLQTSPAAGQQQLTVDGSDITAEASGGSIGGALRVLNQGLPGLQQRLDTLASSLAAAANTTYRSSFFTPLSGTAGAAANIQVALSSASQVQAGSTILSGDNSTALAMAALRAQNMIGAQTATSYHSDTVLQLGQQISDATTNESAGQQVLDHMNQQRQAVEGVSLDKEAANLMQYERAYQAAARLLSTVDQMMQSAIGLGAR
ncbi:MAG: flagellar hook-associated protein FlgK [Acidobacteriaceae bacterium]